jgi:outer membrane protein
MRNVLVLILSLSFPRRRESIARIMDSKSLNYRRQWIPAFAGMTMHCVLLLLSAIPQANAADLNQIFNAALSSDPLLRSEKHLNRAVNYDKNKACGQMLPQVTASAGYANYDQGEAGTILGEGSALTSGAISGEQKSITATASQTILDFPKFAECRMGYIKVSLENTTYEVELEDMIYRVSKAYMNVLLGKSKVNAADAAVELAQSRLEQAMQGFQAKTKSQSDLDLATANLEEEKVNKIKANNEYYIAKRVLGNFSKGTINVDNLADLQEKIPLLSPNPADPNHWADIAQKNNLKLIESKLSQDVSHFAVKSEQAKHLPTVNAFAKHSEYENNLERPTGSLDSDNGNFSNDVVGVTLTWKLFSGGSDMAGVSAAKSRYRSAKEIYEQATNETRNSTEEAVLNLLSNIASVNASEAMLIASESELKSTQDGIQAGTKTNADLLDARSKYLGVMSKFDEARYNYVMGTLDFWRAIGALSSTSIQEINSWLVNQDVIIMQPDSMDRKDFWKMMGQPMPVSNTEASDLVVGKPSNLYLRKPSLKDGGVSEFRNFLGLPPDGDNNYNIKRSKYVR